MSESWRAVYRDQQGRTYSCPVVQKDGAWVMVTSDGTQPINLEFQDDVEGTLSFVGYREAEPNARLHLEPRRAGESSFAQLQPAHAKLEAEARTDRHQERQQVLTTNPDTRIQQAQAQRATRNEIARQMRPRGGGQFIIKGEQ